MKNVMIVSLILALTACAPEKETAQFLSTKEAPTVNETPQQQVEDSLLSEKNVNIEFTEQKTPGMYLLTVTWPQEFTIMKVSINNSFSKTILAQNKFQQEVPHSTALNIQVTALDESGAQLASFKISKTSPADLILQKNLELTGNAEFVVQRVYIPANTRIITKGYNLSIVTDKLFIASASESQKSEMDPYWAQILTNALGAFAADHSQTRSSQISIKARKAIGVLHVQMFGVNGLDGKDGSNAAYNSYLDGSPGTAGEIQSSTEQCTENSCRKIDTNVFCARNPTNGSNGRKGFTGEAGQDGMNGGDTGTLSVLVEDSSEFKIEVALKAGTPGKGGAGGHGSPGGNGGVAGHNPSNKCTPAKDGEEGPMGDAGRTGTNGVPGKVFEPTTNVIDTLIKVIK